MPCISLKAEDVEGVHDVYIECLIPTTSFLSPKYDCLLHSLRSGNQTSKVHARMILANVPFIIIIPTSSFVEQ